MRKILWFCSLLLISSVYIAYDGKKEECSPVKRVHSAHMKLWRQGMRFSASAGVQAGIRIVTTVPFPCSLR